MIQRDWHRDALGHGRQCIWELSVRTRARHSPRSMPSNLQPRSNARMHTLRSILHDVALHSIKGQTPGMRLSSHRRMWSFQPSNSRPTRQLHSGSIVNQIA